MKVISKKTDGNLKQPLPVNDRLTTAGRIRVKDPYDSLELHKPLPVGELVLLAASFKFKLALHWQAAATYLKLKGAHAARSMDSRRAVPNSSWSVTRAVTARVTDQLGTSTARR